MITDSDDLFPCPITSSPSTSSSHETFRLAHVRLVHTAVHLGSELVVGTDRTVFGSPSLAGGERSYFIDGLVYDVSRVNVEFL